MTFKPKENTHLVIKNEDADKYLTEQEGAILGILVDKISCGRLADGKSMYSYYICNTDEPYAEEVLAIIRKHEGGE